jgi:N-acetyl sugar amidotransferase
MKYCNKCVIPETAETQTFDNKGKCSVCKQIEVKSNIDWDAKAIDLDNLIKEYKGKADYDCIIPFSGGKDSTFALWYLVKKKNIRPLVVRFDHNFLRKTLNENTEKTLNKLGVDFVNFKPNFEIVKKMMFESLFRRGDFCWHCHVGITAYPINTAMKKNIPLVFYGEPSAEYSSFYSYDEIEELDVEKFNKAVNLGINAEDMLEMLRGRYPNEKFDVKAIEPYVFPTQREINKKGIKAVYLGNYIPWNVKKQVEIIKSELDWKGDVVEGIPQQYDYEKIECIMQGVRDYIRFIKRGYGRTSHLVSIDIRNNRMTREKAEELVKMHDGKRPKALDTFLGVLNISEDEFYEIVEKHVVSPHKMPDKNMLKKNKSNIIPHDAIDWNKKFI